MTFGQPFLLWAFVLIPLTLIFLHWAQRRRLTALLRLGNVGLIQQLSATVNWRGRRWQNWLWMMAVGLIILAMARPQWGSEVQVVEQEGVQVMVVLDISKSMLTADLKPDRLTRAKFEISDLMNRLKGDEVGLTLFSGASFIQFPLTSDYDTARAFLENAKPGMISRPGTAIGEALRTAMSGFDTQRSNQKVIVLMTDGEDHEADPIAMAEAVAKQGVILYTIGFGSLQGEPIPDYNGQGKQIGYHTDQNGNPVLSKLDESTLQQLALAAHGRYFRASAGGEELDALVKELDQLQKAQSESRFARQPIERYQIFLLVGILALVWHELIPDRVQQSSIGKRRLWQAFPKPVNLLVILLIIGLGGCTESAGKTIAQGNEAFGLAEYDRASSFYQSAHALNPKAAEPIYNLANTAYRQEVYSTTQEFLSQTLTLATGDLLQSSYYNLGNTLYQTQQWGPAIDAYKEALRLNPTDQDAKHNLELALRQLQEIAKQAEPNQDPPQPEPPKQEPPKQEPPKQEPPTPTPEPPTPEPAKHDLQQPDKAKPDDLKADQQQPNDVQQEQEKPEEAKPDPAQQDALDEQQSDPPKQDPAEQDQSQQDQSTQTTQIDKTGQKDGPALSVEQARQLLNSVGHNARTLQERLQEIYQTPGSPPAKDW